MAASRKAALCCMLLACAADAGTVIYFEDHFDANALLPEWMVMGSGDYELVDGDLEFITRRGDLVDGYGLPRHVFLILPNLSLTEWRAVARVRYNTPDETYEQVSVLAVEDDDNYIKSVYHYGTKISPAGPRFNLFGQADGHTYAQGPVITPSQDYFWLRLDRIGDEYTCYGSTDTTTDPDAVEWDFVGTCMADLGASPTVGIAGWNTGVGPSGELAEFDYFRLSSIPRYTLSIYTGGLGTVLRDPDMDAYPEGTVVTVTAVEDYGYNFKFWKVYDPNHPGDGKYVVRDNNNPIRVVMNDDREVDAIYGCSTGGGPPLLILVMGSVGVMKLRTRRWGRSSGG